MFLQVCNELHLKLSREEAYDASQPVTPVQSGGVEEPAQHDAAPSFRQPSVEYGDTETSNVCAASQFDTLEGSVSTPVSTAEQDECKDDGRTYDNNESRETVAIAVEGTGGCQQANASTTIAHSELQNECRVTVETGNERDSAHTNENGGARAALEPDGVSVELQAALDQLEAEQSRWEEELAREQREREVIHPELMFPFTTALPWQVSVMSFSSAVSTCMCIFCVVEEYLVLPVL